MAFAILSSTAHASKADCYGRSAGGRQQRFKVVEGEVEDTKTGLTWKRCSLGTEWKRKAGCVGQVAYLGLNEAIASAADGWRVPTGPELETIVDVGCGRPVVDQSVFTDIKADEEGHAKYWSTSAYVWRTSIGILISSMVSRTQIHAAFNCLSGSFERRSRRPRAHREL